MVISQRLYHVPHKWIGFTAGTGFVIILIVFSKYLKLSLLQTIAIKIGLITIAAFVLLLLGFIRKNEIRKIKRLLSARGNS
jgi:uncharacterized membrane protein